MKSQLLQWAHILHRMGKKSRFWKNRLYLWIKERILWLKIEADLRKILSQMKKPCIRYLNNYFIIKHMSQCSLSLQAFKFWFYCFGCEHFISPVLQIYFFRYLRVKFLVNSWDGNEKCWLKFKDVVLEMLNITSVKSTRSRFNAHTLFERQSSSL